ncbi:hypothetical protein [Silvanigrella aquatica]|nr:hypothetical protein [Silvanigrella aquatica]
MKRKAILLITSFVFSFALYSIGMLFLQYKISHEVQKNFKQIIKNSSYIKDIEFRRITLSPLFFINKKYEINDVFLTFNKLHGDIFIRKITIEDFILEKSKIIPKFVKADCIEFLSLNKLKQQIIQQLPEINNSTETVNYFLNSPTASFKADYQYGQYTAEFNIFLNKKIILYTSYNLKNLIPDEEQNQVLLNLKSFKLNLDDLPIDSKKMFSKNEALHEILGQEYNNLLLNLNINYQKTNQSNEDKSLLESNISIKNIINIKLSSKFYIDNILNPEKSIIQDSYIQIFDQDFLNKYFQKEAIKKNTTLEEIKKNAIQQNEFLLLFIEKTPLEAALHEFNKYILNPNKFTIKIHPEHAITCEMFYSLFKEDYFGLLRLLNIKFKANSDIIDWDDEVHFP